MEGRLRLILRHWIDSLVVSVLAGVAALALRFYVTERSGSLVDGLACRPYLIPVIAGLPPLLLAIICPARLVASLKSIRLFPSHVGICLRAMIGILIIVVADLALFGTDSYYRVDAGTALWAVGAFVVAMVLGYPCSAWLAAAGRARTHTDQSPGNELQSDDSWLIADEAIKTADDNRFPGHESVASRILTKLLSERAAESWLVPSVALIGPYGSGKTSICNLVEDDYLRRAEKEKLPRMLFCRFEAWQFLSPGPATAGLVRAVTERVLEVTDELSLWRVPDHYVEAMKECGGRWGKLLVPLLGGSDDPGRALFRIGDTLARLDLRVVVFVDDFDRIEEDSPATQQAVAKALNQFQGMPNLQYVITVGPTSGYGREAAERHVSWDLLKLTRYQELVPRLETRYLVELTKKWRDHAQEDRDYFYPWAYISEHDSDPLTFHAEFELIYSRIGLIGNLAGLVNTPRACKAVLRETVKAWDCGLKGEIDWYDLLLINAIRVAEPGVFEWIARDPNVFLEEPAKPSGNRDKEQEAKYADELRTQLEAAVSSTEPKQFEIVKKVMARLFPYFNAKLELGIRGYLSSVAPNPWSQKICSQEGIHSDYLRRFFAGCVPPGDVPDQPTLRYIRAIAAKGFEPEDFARLYLDSLDKLTGPLNKVVQFAGLITPELAYRVCDTMLDWIADPAHATMWPEPERFMIGTLPDVFAIVDRAGIAHERQVPRDTTVDEARADERLRWVEAVIKRYMPIAPLLSLSFARASGEKGYKRVIEQLPSAVFREFKYHFIEKELPFLPGLTISRFSLAWLLGDLLHVVTKDDYSLIKRSPRDNCRKDSNSSVFSGVLLV